MNYKEILLIQFKAPLGVNPGVPGGFSGHILTLLPKPVLYVTLIHLYKISKFVYFLRKVKLNLTLLPIFLHPQQFDPYVNILQSC